MNVRLKCNCCGRTAEGTVGELHALGWRSVTRRKGKRDKTITECPEHRGIMTGRE
ncbi:MAG: hypothetical protein GXX95_01315 [Methanomassiliicoccus sp.]|nr:hypothetical protein [Methanomassiliicoccus sp.]